MLKAKLLKDLIHKKDIIITPGCFDCISAIICEKLGFDSIVMGGYSLSASLLGKPDIGLLTMTGMVDALKRIADVVNLPIIADGDTGFGGEFNIKRTIKEYERAGASAIILEDQSFPKRCGHLNGKSLISKEDHANKIKIAKDSACDMLVFARTDALAIHGFDEAISRALYYLRAGADGIFIESPRNENDLIMIGRQLKGQTLIVNNVEGGKTPILKAEQLKKMGYKIIMYPVLSIYLYSKNLFDGLKTLLEEGTSTNIKNIFSFDEFNDLLLIQKYLKK